MTCGIDRRRMLAASLLLASMTRAFGQTTNRLKRIVVLDWGLATTLLALDFVPVGIAELDLYRRWVVEPPIPGEVQDVGLRTEPNLEMLAALQPDLILLTPLSEAVRPRLERIAPTQSWATFTQEGRPLEQSAIVMRNIAAQLGREAKADAVLKHVDETFQEARHQLRGKHRRPLLLISFMDARHVRVYGSNSLFGGVLDRLGLINAWTGLTNPWGFSLTSTTELAAYPDAHVLIIEPSPDDVRPMLSGKGLWGYLPFVRAGRVSVLPPVWAFGDVTTGERFARVLMGSLRAYEASHAD